MYVGEGVYPDGINLPIFVKCPLTQKLIEVHKTCVLEKCPVYAGLQAKKDSTEFTVMCFHFPRCNPSIGQSRIME
jgi:hypothetical protein